jgi:glycosyltransferase involved in cell wall biosynthesis
MKILILTGLFPPDIGGPAIYTERLANKFVENGIEVEVICYSDSQETDSQEYDFPVTRISRNHYLPLRYFLYFWSSLKKAKNVEIIYVQDLFSSGIPAALVKRFFRKKLAIRLGGDFLWEKAIENNWTKKPLREYYQQPKNYYERLLIWLSQRVLNTANLIIFSTDWQKEIFSENYKIGREKIKVIQNPFPEITPIAESSANQKIIFHGRLVKLKNVDFLIRAFNQVLKNQPDLQLEIIGQGPRKKNLEKLIKELNLERKVIIKEKVSHQQLIKEIGQCFLMIIPSLTEVSPGLVLECIKIKKPLLLTKETGFYERFKNVLIFIDPFNQKDLINKINYLLDKENYRKYQEKISLIPTDYSWSEVAQRYISILKK